MNDLFALVKRIPKGRAASYGTLGAALDPPVSGFQVGRWLGNAPGGVPWWRVVGKNGDLPVWKRSPDLAEEQLQKLQADGCLVQDFRVAPECLLNLDEAVAL